MAENCFQQVSALDLAPKGSWPGFGLKRPSWSWSGRKYRGMLTTSNRLYFEILQRRDKKNHEHCFGGWLSSPPSQVCLDLKKCYWKLGSSSHANLPDGNGTHGILIKPKENTMEIEFWDIFGINGTAGEPTIMSLSLFMSIHLSIHFYLYMHIHIYIYIYLHMYVCIYLVGCIYPTTNDTIWGCFKRMVKPP